MQDIRIATTSTAGLKPLGTAHQRSFELVTDAIRARLSDRHADLFAEPVQSEFGDKIDWYVHATAAPQPLPDVDEDAVWAEVQTTLDGLRADILAEAESLSASSHPDDQRLAQALENAVAFPGPDCIYVLQGPDGNLQPVIVNWAYSSDQTVTVRGTLSGQDTRIDGRAAASTTVGAMAVPATAEATAPDQGAPIWIAWLYWIGWLLLALMIAAILYLMLPACGLRLPGAPNTCPPPAEEQLAVVANSAVLRDEIAQLEHAMAVADRACQPLPPQPIIRPPAPPPPAPPPETAEPATPPAPVEPAPPAESEIDRRLARDGGQLGELTFSLAWNSETDLDLHVTCPTGTRVFYGNRNACGGALDIDANAGNRTREPLENIYFNAPNAGPFAVRVHLYRSATGGRSESFELQIRDGNRVETLRGTVTPGQPNWSTTYEFGGQ
ncbi:MAG: hypothetical protein AAF376_02635 [Pseudomonadota bacterium]